MNDTVIKIENVSKQYRLGTIGGGTLKGDLQSWWARVRHKDDPNLKIGQTAYAKNETFMALENINLEIKRGEAIGLIGGNGAGKSTTLKLLSRVTAPTEGSIYIKGKISSMLEVGTGFHGELTGRENIYLNGAILGMSRNEVDKKIEDIIDFSECRQFIDTPVKRYSSGMFVKLAFSVAAHLDNDIMLMDEVLAVGDMAFQKKCIDKMLSVIHDSQKTIIYVSHNMQTIRQLCSRGVVLEKGRIIYDGDVEHAIGLYLHSEKMQSKLSYDFTERKRLKFLTDKVQLDSMRVVGRDDLHIQDGEQLRFCLRWHCLEDVSSLSMRMMVHNNDQGVIATAVCPAFMSCKAGEVYEREFVMNTDVLSTGTYKVLTVMFETDELGSVIDADAVYPGLIFEREKKSSLSWKSNLFGDVELPEIKVVAEECST
jgi:lipopolysaccharide transport system ATP-binding protein